VHYSIDDKATVILLDFFEHQKYMLML
jgi:hypothetical protein